MDPDRNEQDARAVLAAYRAVRVPPDVRARVWQRLQADVDEDEGLPTLVAQELEDEEEAAAPRRRGRGAGLGVALLVAAALVLLVAGLKRLPGLRGEAVENQAAHDATVPAPVEKTVEKSVRVEEAKVEAPTHATVPVQAPTERRSPGARAGTTEQAEVGSSLEAELALLREARAALTRGDGATTLRLVAEHERQFLNGHLAEERMVLRAQALCEQGDREGARAAVTALLAAYPNSPHAGTLAATCREG